MCVNASTVHLHHALRNSILEPSSFRRFDNLVFVHPNSMPFPCLPQPLNTTIQFYFPFHKSRKKLEIVYFLKKKICMILKVRIATLVRFGKTISLGPWSSQSTS